MSYSVSRWRAFGLACASIAFGENAADAALLVNYSFSSLSLITTGSVSGVSNVPTSGVPNVISVSRGSGLSAASANQGYSSSAWPTSATIDPNKHYAFGLEIAPGYRATITDIKTGHRVSTATPVPTATLRSDLDSYTANLGTASLAQAANTLVTFGSGTPLQAIVNTGSANLQRNYRVYGTGFSAGTTTFRLENNPSSSSANGLMISGETYALSRGTGSVGAPSATTAFVGATVTQAVTVGNNTGSLTVSAGGSKDDFNYSLAGSGYTTASGAVASGGSSLINLAVNTITAGPRGGTVTLSSTNGAGTPNYSIDGSIASAASKVYAPPIISVLDHSNGSFSSGFDQNGLLIDFGEFDLNESATSIGFAISNLVAMAGYTGDLELLADGISGSGDTSVLSTSAAAFTTLPAGSSQLFSASFDTSALGEFSATYTFATRDASGIVGSTINSQPLMLVITGSVVPEPASLGMLGIASMMLLRRRK